MKEVCSLEGQRGDRWGQREAGVEVLLVKLTMQRIMIMWRPLEINWRGFHLNEGLPLKDFAQDSDIMTMIFKEFVSGNCIWTRGS